MTSDKLLLRNASFTLLLVLLAGCASFTARSVWIDSVAGDLVIREIATDCQMTAGDGTNVVASTNGTVTKSVPVSVNIAGDGVMGISRWRVGSVTDSVIIERVLTGAQNIDIPGSLGKLFVPGDPFAAENE